MPSTSSVRRNAAELQRLKDLKQQLLSLPDSDEENSSNDGGDVSSAPRPDNKDKDRKKKPLSDKMRKSKKPVRSSDDEDDYDDVENSEVDDMNDQFRRGTTISDGKGSEEKRRKVQEYSQMHLTCSEKPLSDKKMVNILAQTLDGVYQSSGLKSWGTKAKKGSAKVLPSHMNPKFNISPDFRKEYDEVDHAVKSGDKEHYYDLLKAAINASLEKPRDVSSVVDQVVERLCN